jgi:hypothetical protein
VEVGSGINPLPISDFDDIYRKNLPLLIVAAQWAAEREDS